MTDESATVGRSRSADRPLAAVARRLTPTLNDDLGETVVGVAAYEDRIGVRRTALPLAVGGGAVAAYHSYLQSRPAATCSTGGCGSVQFELFGLLSIPNLSLLAFSSIAAGLALTAVRSR